ncbi:MAG: type II secretion system F family protein [Acidimicrobiaceae bacterium]|nr:type II secretion system F family protein [Acidimicrobiaceae bacterium]
MRALAVLSLLAFFGMALLLSEQRWINRPRLTDRLAPYAPGFAAVSKASLLSVASFREVVAPLSQVVGERIARVFGISEELGVRLRRIHSPLDATTFRVRQIGWASTTFMVGTLGAVALRLPAVFAVLVVLGAPILSFLLLEQQVVGASAAWQRRLSVELPVVAEQLGMLMSAGWSLSAALNRVAERGSGNCSKDLKRVVQRVRQGLTEAEALQEWTDLAQVEALERLISILALNRETADLGRLISTEARSIRRENQRELIEAIEKRTQQVWIPVTAATLVPGLLLMGIPFLDALSLFSTA